MTQIEELEEKINKRIQELYPVANLQPPNDDPISYGGFKELKLVKEWILDYEKDVEKE